MPISVTVEKESRRLRTVVEGQVSIDEVTTHFQTLTRDGLAGLPDLIDARPAQGPGWHSPDLRRAADLVSTFASRGPFGPCAVVVSSNAAFGMVRTLSAPLASRMPMEVFRDTAEAEAWLDGVSPRPAGS